MLYKPKNLCPSTKLLPIVYSKETDNDYVLDFSFSSELHNEFQNTCELEIKCGNEIITAENDRTNIESSSELPKELQVTSSWGTDVQIDPKYFIVYDSPYMSAQYTDLRQKNEDGQYLNTTTSGYIIYLHSDAVSCQVGGHTVKPSTSTRNVYAAMTIAINQYIEEDIEIDIKSKPLAVLSDAEYNAKKIADLFKTFFIISGNFSIEADVMKSSNDPTSHVSENLDFNQKYEIQLILNDAENPVRENPEDGEFIIPFRAIHSDYNIKTINKLVSIVGKLVFIRNTQDKSVSISKLILTPQNAIYAAHDRALTTSDEYRYVENEEVLTSISVDFYAQVDKFANDTIIAATYPDIELKSIEQKLHTDVKTYYINNLDLYKDKQSKETGESYFNKLLTVTSDQNKWKWRVKCTDKNSTDHVYSNWETFLIEPNRATPKISISSTQENLQAKKFQGKFISEAKTYNSYISNYQWKIYYINDLASNKKTLLHQTDRIYSQDFQYYYENFIEGDYEVEAIVEDNYGQIYNSTHQFSINYGSGAKTRVKSIGCSLNIENTSNVITWSFPQEVDINYQGYNLKRVDVFSNNILDMGEYFTSADQHQIIDYSLPHNREVKYTIYGKIRENQEYRYLRPYNTVNIIKGSWDKWCLFTTKGPTPKNLNNTDEDLGYNENVLLVDKIFFFEMNVETGSMTNNTDFSIIKNFTPYPHIQRSPSNYWSGQLKGLLGRLAIDDATFKQTPDMLQEIKDLTQNTNRKFLKDRDGNFWEIELSSAITIDNNDQLDVQLKTKSFNWVEIGDASNIALVSIGKVQDDWLLTELGQQKIDLGNYLWDDNAIWNDSDFWTEVQP